MLDTILVALDVEATGMEPGVDHIIEVGALKFRGQRILDRFESLVRPERMVSFSIESLTGLSNEQLRDAPHLGSVLPRLKSFVGNSPIIGQSIEFDMNMLSAAGLDLRNRRYDTFELATILLPELPTYDLGTIAAALGVEAQSRHRAVNDAEMSMAVFNRLVERASTFDDQTLERLADLSRRAGSQLSAVFRGLLRERQREEESYSGSSIGAQLLAKLGGQPSTGPEAMFLVPRDRPRRLEASEQERAIPPDVLDAAMAVDGPFAQSMPGYEARSQQVEMMHVVAQALNDDSQLIVEAGTGTGKSLGYLLPAALYAVEHGESVVISTATIALQDQLISKDIPALVEAARHAPDSGPGSEIAALADLRASVLKGRGNYLCLRRWFLAQHELPQNPVEAELYAKITAWLHQTETGDRAELRLTPDQHSMWMRLSEEEGACIPGQCIFHRRNQCFLFRARAEAEASHLIIVNHALLLADLLRGGSVLPSFRRLIVDEAHHLEAEATRQAGFSISRAGCQSLLRRVISSDEPVGIGGALGIAVRAVGAADADAVSTPKLIPDMLQSAFDAATRAQRSVDTVFKLLDDISDRYDHDTSGYERRVRITPGMRSDAAWSHVEIEWDQAVEPINQLIEALRSVANELNARTDDDVANRVELLTEVELVESELIALRSRGFESLSQSDSQMISWISRHQTSGEIAVHAVPLHVAELLQSELYDKLDTLVLTSATLTTEGSFQFIRERLGLADAEGVQVPSPFDYQTSTLVAVAEDVPEPNQPGHQKAVQQALIQLCAASRGRGMVLFTSHSALQNSYHAVKRDLESRGILVLGQRIDGSPRQLIERLRDRPQTVIFGTNSFWEGVDIVGDALSLLVITRLPFSVPSDPVFAARSEMFDNPFIQYAVPQAILRFKQGFGRLIRSAEDRGVVVILDRRVVSRRYGRGFTDSLPPAEVQVAPTSILAGAVDDWLKVRDAEEVAG